MVLTLVAAGGLTVAAVGEIPDEGVVEGSWSAERDGEHVQLHLQRGGHHMSFSVPVRSLTTVPLGLELRREAGTVRMSGEFDGARGGGVFRFEGDDRYAAEMERRGHGNLDALRLFELAAVDLTLSFVDGLAELGYDENLQRLIEMRIHGADAAYAKAMRGLGLGELTSRYLVEMRIHRVDPSYVRAVQAADLGDLSARRLVEMRIHRVDPAAIPELRELGLGTLSVNRLVEMGIHGVDAPYARDLQALGLQDLSWRRLVEMRIHGLTPDYVREMGELGYRDLPARRWVEMRIHRVDPEWVRSLKEGGHRDLTARRLVEMRIHGWDSPPGSR
ncbi:MAG: hypothetical protein AAGD06_18130 [Acidobacteriota bacterium]